MKPDMGVAFAPSADNVSLAVFGEVEGLAKVDQNLPLKTENRAVAAADRESLSLPVTPVDSHRGGRMKALRRGVLYPLMGLCNT